MKIPTKMCIRLWWKYRQKCVFDCDENTDKIVYSTVMKIPTKMFIRLNDYLNEIQHLYQYHIWLEVFLHSFTYNYVNIKTSECICTSKRSCLKIRNLKINIYCICLQSRHKRKVKCTQNTGTILWPHSSSCLDFK